MRQGESPPRNGEVAAQLTEGSLSTTTIRRAESDPSTILRMVPLPVPGRN